MTGPLPLTHEELLTTTRCVRRGLDLDRAVDPEVVKDCLRVALQAPNGNNRQNWRWILLTDPSVRADVAAVYRAAFHDRNAGTLERLAELPEGTRSVMSAARLLADRLHRVPVLVIPCLEVPDGRLPEGNQAGLWASLLPAAWNYALAARSRGLVTAWTAVHLDREREVADLLGLPSTVRQGALLPTAHPLRHTFRRGPRLPLEQVLHVNGWQPT
ncbi:nitroreductase family protein [Streptomyces actuosus]|uniref:Nitroreductase family protein n=1 Tax=Streptomyces actuosus TaxID=1885 RepID=A0ABS2W0Y4_STRAS|nr:nitroreductase family protein [Streptomyces actuosus]MBN0048934.1 nitroreductase family protein [Streptomyces actuosus]